MFITYENFFFFIMNNIFLDTLIAQVPLRFKIINMTREYFSKMSNCRCKGYLNFGFNIFSVGKTPIKCDDPREKDMFQDVNVKIQVRTYLYFDVNVLNLSAASVVVTYCRE